MAGEHLDESQRVRENIRSELAAQNALQGLDLDDAVLDTLAWAVAANLLYVFDVTWRGQTSE